MTRVNEYSVKHVQNGDRSVKRKNVFEAECSAQGSNCIDVGGNTQRWTYRRGGCISYRSSTPRLTAQLTYLSRAIGVSMASGSLFRLSQSPFAPSREGSRRPSGASTSRLRTPGRSPSPREARELAFLSPDRATLFLILLFFISTAVCRRGRLGRGGKPLRPVSSEGPSPRPETHVLNLSTFQLQSYWMQRKEEIIFFF